MISNSYANRLLNFIVCNTQQLTVPAKLYLGLCASEPDHATGAVTSEPTASSYDRKVVGQRVEEGESVDTEQVFFGSASSGIVKNSKEIMMKTARTAWGKMYYWFLSESTKGNAILWGEIYDKNGDLGLQIDAETVPVFYENDLRASIGVELEPPKPDTE